MQHDYLICAEISPHPYLLDLPLKQTSTTDTLLSMVTL